MEFKPNKLSIILPGHIETNHIEHSSDQLKNATCDFNLKFKNVDKSIELDTKLMEQLNK